jgi:hypothetical protein
MVDLLIKNEANVNDKSEQGFTALMGGIFSHLNNT